MDKRGKLKAGLIFGTAMAIFFILHDVVTHTDLSSKNILTFIVSGVTGGALAGLLFGWLMGLFANSAMVKETTRIETKSGEQILFETGANHVKRGEVVGGRLYLTNQRLVFKSHVFNIQNHELSISLEDIGTVERYRTLGLVNNGLSVITSDNTIEKYVVQQPEEWVKHLSEKQHLQQA